MLSAPASKVRHVVWYLEEKMAYEAEEAQKQQEELGKQQKLRARRAERR